MIIKKNTLQSLHDIFFNAFIKKIFFLDKAFKNIEYSLDPIHLLNSNFDNDSPIIVQISIL